MITWLFHVISPEIQNVPHTLVSDFLFFHTNYFLRYLSLKTVLNFTVAILELLWSQNPQIKMAVSQKLFKIQISNFRFFFRVEEEQLV